MPESPAALVEPTHLHRTQYDEAQHLEQSFLSRQRELLAQEEAGAIADAELDELLRIERRLARLREDLPVLEEAATREQEVEQVATVAAKWEVLREEHVVNYGKFVTCHLAFIGGLVLLEQSYAALEALVQDLPRRMQEQLNFPDWNTVKARLANQMLPNPQAWHMVLTDPALLRLANAARLAQNDPGTKPLPRLVTRYLAAHHQQTEDVPS
jgi:hypothetical protein